MSKLYRFRVRGSFTVSVDVDKTVEAKSEEDAIRIAIDSADANGHAAELSDDSDMRAEGDDAWQAVQRLRDGRALFGDDYRPSHVNLCAAVDGDDVWIYEGRSLWRALRANVETIAPVDELLVGGVVKRWREMLSEASSAETQEHGKWLGRAYETFALALGGKPRPIAIGEQWAFAIEHESGTIGVVLANLFPDSEAGIAR